MSNLPISVFNKDLIVDGDLSGDLKSEIIEISEIISYSVQAIWSDGNLPVGIMYLEASNDGQNFTRIDDSVMDISGNSGSNIINSVKPSYFYVRFVYSRDSGTGTINVKMYGKRG